MSILFEPVSLGSLSLRNRIVMAPMTRSRAGAADDPTGLHVTYYAQRAEAGLIISEGIQPSLAGKGYARTPGLHTDEQEAAWRRVTDAVHARGGLIVAQLMHVGRVAATSNRPDGTDLIAPSAITAKTELWTNDGMEPAATPRALETNEIGGIVEEYVQSARRAVAAGFDGVELHCTSGYLPAQFMATGANQRDDIYGGSAQNRVRFVVETLQALAQAIGAGRVGFRICPGNPFNDLFDEDPAETHAALLDAVGDLGLAYCHLIHVRTPQKVDQSALLRDHWHGPVLWNQGLDQAKATVLLADGSADAVSFGRPFIANPDLVTRFREGHALAEMDADTTYNGDAKGYIDYPTVIDTPR